MLRRRGTGRNHLFDFNSRTRTNLLPLFLLFILSFTFGNIFLSHQIVIYDNENGPKASNVKGINNQGIHESLNSGKYQNDIPIDSRKNDSISAKEMNTSNDGNIDHTNKNDEQMHDIPEDGFAGCLLLKDDSDRLAEWLAYHWLVLPLKYLVVAIDPTGTTSPEKILNLWKDSNMGIEIDLWNDVDYGHWVNEELDEKHKHRDRQKRFLFKCEKYHKKNGRSWLAMIDPDEYITYNTINDDDPTKERSQYVPEKFLKPQYMKEMESIRKGLGNIFDEQKTVFSFINERRSQEPWSTEPCYLMPRLFFSAIESPHDIISKANVEQYGLDPMKFSTLRYFHHASRGKFDFNHYGKVIVDLTRIVWREIVHDMHSVHRPNHISCLPPTKPYLDGLLRVHHYLGSWEQYSARSDVRRSKERFNQFAFVDKGKDYQLQYWLQKFVEKVGAKKAQRLLSSAGVLMKNSARIMDQLEYDNVEESINDRHGEITKFTYLYDEDGSVVDILNDKGRSMTNKIQKTSTDVFNL